MAKLDTRKSPLIAEFLKDHQQFSRLLFQIIKLLEAGQISEARTRADELDRLAGPHIAFEEAELYPRLQILGERNAKEEMLVEQHHDALHALKQLVDLENPDGDQLESVKAGFNDALKHAEHCGSLISLMTQLNHQEQSESLKSLLDFPAQGQRWTELS